MSFTSHLETLNRVFDPGSECVEIRQAASPGTLEIIAAVHVSMMRHVSAGDSLSDASLASCSESLRSELVQDYPCDFPNGTPYLDSTESSISRHDNRRSPPSSGRRGRRRSGRAYVPRYISVRNTFLSGISDIYNVMGLSKTAGLPVSARAERVARVPRRVASFPSDRGSPDVIL